MILDNKYLLNDYVMIHSYDHLPVGPIKLFRLIDLYILDHRQLFEFFCLPFIVFVWFCFMSILL